MPRAVVELHWPGARQVYLAADFTDWQQSALRMRRRKAGEDVFARVLNLPAGTHQYKFIVDGEWHPDPNAEQVPNDCGSTNSLLHVG
ncbi:MAG: glycogen-binding domain-containing protein [Armatimonadota bacterium]